MTRSLAIDLGARRIGLALSDEGGQLATPLEVLTVTSPEQAVRPIAELTRREGVHQLVVGLPLNMDDSLGPAARHAIEWGRQLAQQCALPVVFVDERLSSFAAEQTLMARKRGGEKLTRKSKKNRLDALAAADFLQAYLDGRLTPIEPPS
jgi:putative Holliday junction resolvase